MRFYSTIFLLLICFNQSFAQNINPTEVDSLYREDQFYAGVSYNVLINKPSDVSQNGFSLGFNLGFIRDVPINKARNKAFGIGIGYSTNSYNQDLLISKDSNGSFTYNKIEDNNSFTKNKFSTHLIELPIEYRWRTSTFTEYEFWRIYVGFKLSYMLAHSIKYNGELGKLRYTDNTDFNKFRYGLTLSTGYNTWNINVYYALNPIFSNNAQFEGSNIDMSVIKLGLIFYIL
ncbi:porin family protein [Tamlana sp. 2201CG12-4]|uniref:porin family protein n=1 Tax=Tamlana sp. 2201CG12-4 TaxID=3112582 RepID=UPI002DB5B870|nr:porin family protein [Tamlana sp. 2201CG12-4]MEC3905858.1 porin family protein [Tamlana sp. 2201CG12-4]